MSSCTAPTAEPSAPSVSVRLGLASHSRRIHGATPNALWATSQTNLQRSDCEYGRSLASTRARASQLDRRGRSSIEVIPIRSASAWLAPVSMVSSLRLRHLPGLAPAVVALHPNRRQYGSSLGAESHSLPRSCSSPRSPSHHRLYPRGAAHSEFLEHGVKVGFVRHEQRLCTHHSVVTHD